MNSIIINGKKINVNGNNISIIDNKVYVDGVLIEDDLPSNVEISFNGSLASLKTDSSVTVHGDVMGNVDAGGSVSCNNIQGSVDAGGSVSCNNIGGDVDAGGSVLVNR